MRKFKLIKEYPGSPELNTEIITTNIFDIEKRNTFAIKGDLSFKLDNPFDYPDFWQEVIEKDYEILLFKHIYGNEYTKSYSKDKSKYCVIPDGSEYTENQLLVMKDICIYSVKRLSDGKIFTIGDKVQDSLTDKLTNYAVQEITYFYHGEKIICQAKSGTTMPLNTIRHTSFLFKTEDGVEIFEGDSVWGFYTGYGYVFEQKDLKRAKIEQWLKFSTKEKAEKYILLNKPCLSINDIRNCINQTEIDIDNEHELNYQLNELVKLKLYGNK